MNEQQLREAMRGIAEADPVPDEGAAWKRIQDGIEADQRSGRRRTILGVSGLAIAGAAAALVLLTGTGDDREAVEVIPADTSTTTDTVATTDTTAADASTTETTRIPAVVGAPPSLPESVLVVATVGELQLWDGDERVLLAILTTAGAGRPEIPEAYRFGPVSLGDGEVWFTEYAGPEDQPSIWRFDLQTGEREQVVEFGADPAISPDGARLAYVEAAGQPGAVPALVVRDLASGDELHIETDDPGTGVPFIRVTDLEWSPDGARLLYRNAYEDSVVRILDPRTAVSLSDAVALDGEHGAPAWVDDRTIVSQRRCCNPYYEETPRFVFSDAETGMELGAADGAEGRAIELAVGPDGRILFLLEAPIEGRLTLPGPGGAVEVEGVRSADW